MLIRYVAFSFTRGGAAIAARKFMELGKKLGDVKAYCVEPLNDGFKAEYPGRVSFYFHFLLRLIEFFLLKLYTKNVPVKHSLNLFSCSEALAAFQASERGDVVHVHWINNDAVSIEDFRKLPKGSIVTLHDEWLFSGAEHYSSGFKGNDEIVSGYDGVGFSVDHLVNKWCWKRKYNTIGDRNDLLITAPSSWMVQQAKNSPILSNKRIFLLPNPIDTEIFCPMSEREKRQFRKSIGIGSDQFVFVFGAVSLENNPLKGGAELREAMRILHDRLPDSQRRRITLVTFGDSGRKDKGHFSGFEVVRLGKVNQHRLRDIYGSGDFTLVPSQVEAFGQVAAESLSCGTPVVCFGNSGLLDIVDDGKNGFLAKDKSIRDLAFKLEKAVVLDGSNKVSMSRNARDKVVAEFSYPAVLERYRAIIGCAAQITSS